MSFIFYGRIISFILSVPKDKTIAQCGITRLEVDPSNLWSGDWKGFLDLGKDTGAEKFLSIASYFMSRLNRSSYRGSWVLWKFRLASSAEISYRIVSPETSWIFLGRKPPFFVLFHRTFSIAVLGLLRHLVCGGCQCAFLPRYQGPEDTQIWFIFFWAMKSGILSCKGWMLTASFIELDWILKYLLMLFEQFPGPGTWTWMEPYVMYLYI